MFKMINDSTLQRGHSLVPEVKAEKTYLLTKLDKSDRLIIPGTDDLEFLRTISPLIGSEEVISIEDIKLSKLTSSLPQYVVTTENSPRNNLDGYVVNAVPF